MQQRTPALTSKWFMKYQPWWDDAIAAKTQKHITTRVRHFKLDIWRSKLQNNRWKTIDNISYRLWILKSCKFRVSSQMHRSAFENNSTCPHIMVVKKVFFVHPLTLEGDSRKMVLWKFEANSTSGRRFPLYQNYLLDCLQKFYTCHFIHKTFQNVVTKENRKKSLFDYYQI